MAKVNLFTAAAIAMEEEDIGTSSSVSKDVAQNEVENIEAQNEVEEVAKISSEIEQVASQIEEGIDEGEKLDEAIVEGEEVLENNEGGDVPEEAVDVAQEALSESILLLAGREGKKQFKPSLESYETNIQKLRVSLEAAKDFANNIWQKIKELFAKFVVMIKKFTMRISAMFDKGTKQADALAKLFAQRTEFDSSKVNDEFKDKLANAYPTFIKAYSLDKIGNDIAMGEPTKLLDSLDNIVKDVAVGKKPGEQGGAKAFANLTGVKPDLKEDDKDGNEELVMAIGRRSSVWYIGSQGTTGSEKIEVSGNDIEVKDLGASNLATIANGLKSKAKAYQSTVKNAINTLNKASKEIDKLRDAELKGAIDYEEKAAARKHANIAAKISTQGVFQAVAAAQDMISGKLAILSILSSAYKKA